MNVSDDIKKTVLSNILDEIGCISDKEYQRRTWIKGEGPDFDEACCRLFDDNQFDYVLDKYQDYKITDRQYQVSKIFRDGFRTFSDENHWPPEFIDTPEWGKIMMMAKDVLKAFDYKKTTL